MKSKAETYIESIKLNDAMAKAKATIDECETFLFEKDAGDIILFVKENAIVAELQIFPTKYVIAFVNGPIYLGVMGFTSSDSDSLWSNLNRNMGDIFRKHIGHKIIADTRMVNDKQTRWKNFSAYRKKMIRTGYKQP